MTVAETMKPNKADSLEATRPRRRLFFAVTLTVIAAIAVAVFNYNHERQLSRTEQKLVGAWQWQQGSGSMVLYFDEVGILTYANPPFTTFQFERWRIDGSDRIHFEMDGDDLSAKVGRVLGVQADVYDIRFEGGNAILTEDNGTVRVLVPYTGNGAQALQDAR